MAYKARKRKVKKNIPEGQAHIHSTFNNTIVTITDKEGNVCIPLIEKEFPDTKLEDLITVIDRYKKIDTWPKTTEFTEESFNHLQDIMINAKQLTNKVNYKDLVYIK